MARRFGERQSVRTHVEINSRSTYQHLITEFLEVHLMTLAWSRLVLRLEIYGTRTAHEPRGVEGVDLSRSWVQRWNDSFLNSW